MRPALARPGPRPRARVAHCGRSALPQPAKSASIWVNNKTLPTGFVGLAIADYLQPWVTFRTKHAQ